MLGVLLPVFQRRRQYLMMLVCWCKCFLFSSCTVLVTVALWFVPRPFPDTLRHKSEHQKSRLNAVVLKELELKSRCYESA